MMSGIIWKFRAAWYLKRHYHFDWDDAWQLAHALYLQDDNRDFYPQSVVDIELSYWD